MEKKIHTKKFDQKNSEKGKNWRKEILVKIAKLRHGGFGRKFLCGFFWIWSNFWSNFFVNFSIQNFSSIFLKLMPSLIFLLLSLHILCLGPCINFGIVNASLSLAIHFKWPFDQGELSLFLQPTFCKCAIHGFFYHGEQEWRGAVLFFGLLKTAKIQFSSQPSFLNVQMFECHLNDPSRHLYMSIMMMPLFFAYLTFESLSLLFFFIWRKLVIIFD